MKDNKLSDDKINELKDQIKKRLSEDENDFVEEELNSEEMAQEIVNITTKEEAEELLEDYHIVDIIDGIDEVDKDKDVLHFFKLLDSQDQAHILEEADEDLQLRLIDLLDDDSIIDIFTYMPPDDIADILGELNFQRSKSILDKMKRSEANKIRELLGYGEDTAGGIMTTRFIAFKSSLTVEEVMEKIKLIAPKTEYIETVFVLNDKKELIGEVDLRDILIAEKNTTLNDLMDENIIFAHVNDDQETVAQMVSKYGLKVIAVVNNKLNLLGIITIDDIIDVIQEENTEDLLRLSGVSDEEEIDTKWYLVIKKRLPWLVINLVTAFLASFTVGLFSNTIDAVIALAAAMPIVSGMGGNAGTQSLAVAIRSIALGEYEEGQFSVVLKYFITGLINGTILGILCGTIIYIIYKNIFLSLIILLSMIGNLIIACIMGYAIPFILKALKIDPAMASAVILTTITDVLGFFLFLGLATVFITKLV